MIASGLAAIVVIIAAVMTGQPVAWIVVAVSVVLVAIISWVFRSLTVEVTQQELQWYFGPGLWRHRMPLSDIANVEPAHYPWWRGSGIRRLWGGWLYNVRPGNAVRIHRRDGSSVSIGTDDQSGLLAALRGKR
jgi:hypothetical protein